MIDIVLVVARVLIVVLLYLFLFAVMRTGIGLVKGQRKDSAVWTLDLDKGPKNLRGLHVDVLGPVIIGRSPSADIVIDEPFVSSNHARLSMQGPALVLEDLGSTNGTFANGIAVEEPDSLNDGDEVQVGDAILRVCRR